MNNDDVKNTNLCRALSRRRFLRGAAGLTIGGLLAGCGGGGGDFDFRDVYDATFRVLDLDRSVAASVTVDGDGILSFWSLLAAERSEDRLFDFGQVFLNDTGFEVVSGTGPESVRTFGDFSRDRLRARTEDAGDGAFGFGWDANRVGRPRRAAPPLRFVGAFEGFGSGRVLGVDVDVAVLLGVSSDGNATVFGIFDGLEEPYAFESLSFDNNGAGYDPFFQIYEGETLSLADDPRGGILLVYDFPPSPEDPDGATVEIPLQRSRAQSPGRKIGAAAKATRLHAPAALRGGQARRR